MQKSYSSKYCNIYWKTPVIESIFNKVRLVTLTKKTWCMYFIVNLFEIIKRTIVKHLRKIPGKYPRDCWSKYHYSVLWGFSFWVIAFLGPFPAIKEFISKLFVKALRNSLKFLEICALLSIWYCYLHNFFPCSFHIILVVNELTVEVNSFDVHRSSLIKFLFLLNHEELYWLEIRDFHIKILFAHLLLVMHSS